MERLLKPLLLISLIVLLTSACASAPEPGADSANAGAASSSGNYTSSDSPPSGESPDDEPAVEAPSDEQDSGEEPRLSATVTHHNFSISPEGYFSVFGIAENTDTVPMEFIKAVVVVKDSSGSMIIGDFSYTFLDVLEPGMTSPFNITFMQVPENWSYYEITMMPDPNEFMQTLNQFEILSNSGSPGSYGNYEISGEVRNNGEVPASYTEISAAVFDAAGTLLGVGYGYADLDVIEPLGTSSFSLSIPNLAEGQVSSYQFWLKAKMEE